MQIVMRNKSLFLGLCKKHYTRNRTIIAKTKSLFFSSSDRFSPSSMRPFIYHIRPLIATKASLHISILRLLGGSSATTITVG